MDFTIGTKRMIAAGHIAPYRFRLSFVGAAGLRKAPSDNEN